MLTLHLPERPAVRLALAALLGVVGVGCFAPFELFWLAPLIWGGLFGLLVRSGSIRAACLTGLAFGLGFFLTGVSWVYVSLSVFGGMPWWLAGVATFLFCAVMALFPMAASAAFKRWQPLALWQQAAFARGGQPRLVQQEDGVGERAAGHQAGHFVAAQADVPIAGVDDGGAPGSPRCGSGRAAAPGWLRRLCASCMVVNTRDREQGGRTRAGVGRARLGRRG